MRGAALLGSAVLGVGCAAILGIDDGIPREGGVADAGLEASQPDAGEGGADAGVPSCDVDAAFGAPTAFAKLNTAVQDAHLRLLPNELAAVFQSNRDGGVGGVDIYTATRTTIGDTWTGIMDVTAVDTASNDSDPSISGDGLAIYLSLAGDIYSATRPTPTGTFGTPAALATVSSAGSDFAPYVLSDGSKLYLSSTRDSDAGVASLFVASAAGDGGFSAAALVNGSNLSIGDNRFAALTADELVMYFASNRGGIGTQGGFDVWVATRASRSVGFDAPRVVAEVSSASEEHADWISADRCRLYFSSNRAGDWDLYVATKVP